MSSFVQRSEHRTVSTISAACSMDDGDDGGDDGGLVLQSQCLLAALMASQPEPGASPHKNYALAEVKRGKSYRSTCHPTTNLDSSPQQPRCQIGPLLHTFKAKADGQFQPFCRSAHHTYAQQELSRQPGPPQPLRAVDSIHRRTNAKKQHGASNTLSWNPHYQCPSAILQFANTYNIFTTTSKALLWSQVWQACCPPVPTNHIRLSPSRLNPHPSLHLSNPTLQLHHPLPFPLVHIHLM